MNPLKAHKLYKLTKKLLNGLCPICKKNMLEGKTEFCLGCETKSKDLIQEIVRLGK